MNDDRTGIQRVLVRIHKADQVSLWLGAASKNVEASMHNVGRDEMAELLAGDDFKCKVLISLEVLVNLTFLTMLEAENAESVRYYMSRADAEIDRIRVRLMNQDRQINLGADGVPIC